MKAVIGSIIAVSFTIRQSKTILGAILSSGQAANFSLKCSKQNAESQSREVLVKLLLTISTKPVGVRAASQRLLLAAEQFGLLTRIATTERVSLCTLIKS
jgi:hypothetical protein